MNKLFVNIHGDVEQCYLDTKTFIILSVFKAAQPCKLRLNVRSLPKSENTFIKTSLDNINFEVATSETDELTDLSVWPVILLNDNYVISGLCSVARQICRSSDRVDIQKLLGFREACLVSCAEVSVWTKFCEIDIVRTIKRLVNNDFILKDGNIFSLPEDVLKYENHLSQPVKIHNVYKIARINRNCPGLKSGTPREDLGVPHDYAEDLYMTLADLILHACFRMFYKYCQIASIQPFLPLIQQWFARLEGSDMVNKIDFSLADIPIEKCQRNIVIPIIDNVSLYKSDPQRSAALKHTKQYKIESALNLVEEYKRDFMGNVAPFGSNRPFDWRDIPLAANPRGGSLPASRAARKCHQLENLIKATLEVVDGKRYKIVDFCSGSGHLGLLIALVLPHCQIILVENKERSLANARKTISKLGLTNVTAIQSNLDYFVGEFDLGIALHACGLATDLVIRTCIERRADFICCPCCYGAIKNCHELTYPRSGTFRNLFRNVENRYFDLAHAADQTHENDAKSPQGYFCMDVIDNDRRFYAEERGYKVHLGKLKPESCTNKNNLLVGIYPRERSEN